MFLSKMNFWKHLLLKAAVMAVVFLPAAFGAAAQPLNAEVKEASSFTQAKNTAVYSLLDFNDQREFEFARKGLLAAPEALEIFDENGNVIFSQKAFAFVENKEAPASANPSLWRHTQLNHNYGLFEVTRGIYQVRGYDLANMTFIQGETGWIIFDTMTGVHTARAALNLVNETLGARPVTAIIISHPHADHYGGIGGVISQEELAERSVPIIVPAGFEKHAVSENVYAGIAMHRRADYMYGTKLEPGEKGLLGIGLGTELPQGRSSYFTPTDFIEKTGERRVIDGVEMVFQLTPGTEAPVEMNTWFPAQKAFWAAENCTGTLHNLYTLRGAQVREGYAWAKYIMESITLFGDEMEVVFQSHNWPHWGNGVIKEYLLNTAAMYKFINDQTLLYINQGYTANEIANMLTLPDDLAKVWYTRQYYGTVAHNAKAVYQRYMGWYDANPAHLHPITPAESAQKTVEYMGGAENILTRAKTDFQEGQYRWVAEVTMQLIFADPANKEARYLCADALEQLGYQAESGVWRAAYLTGAKELRQGKTAGAAAIAVINKNMLAAMEPEMLFDYLSIYLDANAAQELNLKLNFNLTDAEPYLVTIKSGVLLYQKGVGAKDADAAITLPKAAIMSVFAPSPNELIKITGNKAAVESLYKYMAAPDPHFNIIEP